MECFYYNTKTLIIVMMRKHDQLEDKDKDKIIRRVTRRYRRKCTNMLMVAAERIFFSSSYNEGRCFISDQLYHLWGELKSASKQLISSVKVKV